MADEHQALAEARFPLACDKVVAAVVSAAEGLANATFGRWSFSDLHPGTQVVCGIFHELIVKELTTLPGWRAGEPKKEPDLVQEQTPENSFEVKTSSSLNSIASNRYSWTLDAYDPDRYYLCVNFDPRTFGLYRIRVGFIRRKAWRSQSGRGNVAMLKGEALRSLRECYGGFALDAPVVTLPGFGTASAERLREAGIRTVGDLLCEFQSVQALLSKTQAATTMRHATLLQDHGVQVPLRPSAPSPQPRLP